MTTRQFQYSFTPHAIDPVKEPFVDLTVQEIEDAGIREVLQTPGATLGSWSILDTLLSPGEKLFRFREPLGQAREVKVALSGIFGRFVARAYLTRYHNLSIFGHLGSKLISLDHMHKATIRKIGRGDLPDWVTADAALTKVAIAEAKGCHDPKGPAAALGRAWEQAKRADVKINRKKVPLKRFAVATRWGMANGGPATPMLSVRDPDESGGDLTEEEFDAVLLGIARRHAANMLAGLGHTHLAEMIKKVCFARTNAEREAATKAAVAVLNNTRMRRLRTQDDTTVPESELVGNIVVRGFPAPAPELPVDVLLQLKGTDLRIQFVGIERQWIKAAIVGNRELIREIAKRPRPGEGLVRSDAAASWIGTLGEKIRIEG